MMLGAPQGAARGFIYEPGVWVVWEEGAPLPCNRPLPPSARSRDSKGCWDFCYTHLLRVNKCLQFYIKDGISDRASDCIFFTFIDFKTITLYICVLGSYDKFYGKQLVLLTFYCHQST